MIPIDNFNKSIMKNFFYYLVAAFIMLGFSSCENVPIEEDAVSVKDAFPMPVPSMNWGASEASIKQEMKNLGYSLYDEEYGEGGSHMSFSYAHGMYEVDCIFIEYQYAYFDTWMERAEALESLDWLEKNYSLDDFYRFEGGRCYMYLSKDQKNWVYAEIDDYSREYFFVWGSMKYAASIYDMMLEDFHS